MVARISYLISLLLFCFCSLNAHAGFCEDPFEAICSDADYVATGRTARLEAFKKEAHAYALAQTQNAYGPQFKAVKKKKINFKKASEALLFYYEALYRFIIEKTADIETKTINETDQAMRNYFYKAIDRTSLPQSEKLFLKSKVANTVIATLNWLRPHETAKSGTIRDFAIKTFQAHCNADGMRDNAFSHVHKDMQYIVICPGRLVSAKMGGADHEENVRNIFSVVGHEIGHHFDWKKNPSYYQTFRACLLKHSPTSGGNSIDRYMRELSSEYWNANVLAEYLLHLQNNGTSRDVLIEVMKSAYGPDCHHRAGRTHASGAYVIKNLVRRNPIIHQVMGCKAPIINAKPGCTLNGATAEPLF